MPTDVLTQAERVLLAPPLGNSDDILDDVRIYLSGSRDLARANHVDLPEIDAVSGLGRTMLRAAIDDLVKVWSRSSPPMDDSPLFPALRREADARNSSPLGGLSAISESDHGMCVWIERQLAPVLSDGQSIRIVSPNVDQLATLNEAVSFLHRVIPDIAGSALRHASSVAMIVGPFESGHFAETPEILYLDRRIFTAPWKVAEALLHESLHQKLADLRLSRFVCTELARSPLVTIPWGGRQGNDAVWSIERVLAAAHVYVHLELLYVQTARLLEVDREVAGLKLSAAIDNAISKSCRAGFLLQSLGRGRAREGLGSDGEALVQSLVKAHSMLSSIELNGIRPLGEYSIEYDGFHTVPSKKGFATGGRSSHGDNHVHPRGVEPLGSRWVRRPGEFF